MLISSIGGMGTFLVFACTNLLCFLGVVTFVPETKDKTLEEIADLWKPKGEKRSNAKWCVPPPTSSRPSPTSRPPRPSWPALARAKERAIATKAAAEALANAQKQH